MTRNRRERIAAAINLIKDIKEQITNIMNEESEDIDNIPEDIRETQRGEDMFFEMDQNIFDLDDVCNRIDLIAFQLTELIER